MRFYYYLPAPRPRLIINFKLIFNFIIIIKYWFLLLRKGNCYDKVKKYY